MADPTGTLAYVGSSAGKSITVDVADMKLAQGDGLMLVTHALGSCIGITIYDPVAKVGGMLHYMLPESKINPDKAVQMPYMFSDTGIPRLFRESYRLGADKKRLIVKLAGGANVLDSANYFNIGKKNYLAARKILYQNGVLIRGECVGGTSGKTMRLCLTTGTVLVRTMAGEELEL